MLKHLTGMYGSAFLNSNLWSYGLPLGFCYKQRKSHTGSLDGIRSLINYKQTILVIGRGG